MEVSDQAHVPAVLSPVKGHIIHIWNITDVTIRNQLWYFRSRGRCCGRSTRFIIFRTMWIIMTNHCSYYVVSKKKKKKKKNGKGESVVYFVTTFPVRKLNQIVSERLQLTSV